MTNVRSKISSIATNMKPCSIGILNNLANYQYTSEIIIIIIIIKALQLTA